MLKIETIVTVNNTIVTNVDLAQEIEIIKIINQNEKINIKDLREAALNNLIDEIIKKNEIYNNRISVEEKIINNYFNIFLKNINISKINNKKKNLIYKKIKLNIEWNILIKRLYISKLDVNLNEINNKIDSSKSKFSQKEEEIKIIEEFINQEKNKKIEVYSKLHFERLKKKSFIKFHK